MEEISSRTGTEPRILELLVDLSGRSARRPLRSEEPPSWLETDHPSHPSPAPED